MLAESDTLFYALPLRGGGLGSLGLDHGSWVQISVVIVIPEFL